VIESHVWSDLWGLYNVHWEVALVNVKLNYSDVHWEVALVNVKLNYSYVHWEVADFVVGFMITKNLCCAGFSDVIHKEPVLCRVF
jgi:hypothetical protein